MKRLYPYLFFLFLCLSAQAQEFKVYQFPADKVPAIDGNTHVGVQKLRSCIFYMKHTIIIGGSVRTP